jgi:hypothetical protein
MGHDHYSNPTGCCLLLVHDHFKLPKENSQEKNKEKSQGIYETSEITSSAPKPNLSMDNYDGTKSQKATNNSQRLLEIRPGKDCQPCVWCINFSLQRERQRKFVCNPAKVRQIPSSSGSIWECGSKSNKLGVRELLGNECLDLLMPVETRSSNQLYNNIITQKRINGTMQKLQSYSELVDALKMIASFVNSVNLMNG